MKRVYWIAFFMLILASLACSLTNQALDQVAVTQAGTPTPSKPTATQVILPAATSLPRATIPPTITPSHAAPTQPPTPASTQTTVPTAVSTQTASPLPSATAASPIYSAVLLPPWKKLALRSAPGSDQPAMVSLPGDAAHLAATGREKQIDQTTWIEVSAPSGQTGWANQVNLTREVSPDQLCADPQVSALLANLREAWITRDGKLLRDQVSPLHGLTLVYLRDGTVANYNLDEASWVFESTYQMNWGLHPASGESVRGTFSDEVLPHLTTVFSDSPKPTCGQIQTGGVTYTPSLAQQVRNFPSLSLYQPGPAGQDLAWESWVVGVDYLAGQPYVASLSFFQWEP